jgi:exodeoxyribonuclease VII small subunit
MTKKKQQPQFEEAFKRLETIVAQLESGEESLENSLKLFEEGIQLAENCRTKLDKAEQEISKLIKKSDGSISLEKSDENT